MGLFRVASIVFFFLAALAALNYHVHWSHSTALGLDSAGLFCYALSSLSIPEPPR